ncbi:MAG TPA: fibronectin type III domain-containing protein [Acidimicrobiales bacterium]|nr:fibronectin type III domain-containing protein [Acidimicrobiales bacterium]
MRTADIRRRSPILSYRANATSPHEPPLRCTAVASSCTLRGLRAGGSYVVKATALNAAGVRGHFARQVVRSK